jgi:probable HAF family extracellular repeat protein
MHDWGTLGGTYSNANCISASGQMVGEAGTATGDTHAFVYVGTVMRDLKP